MLSVQNVEGGWTRKEWTDWNSAIGRQSVTEWLHRLETECVARLRSEPPSQSPPHCSHSLWNEVRGRITECRSRANTERKTSAPRAERGWHYQIAVVVEEHGLNLLTDPNDDADLLSTKWERARSELVSWCRSDAICLNVMAMSLRSASRWKKRKYSDFKTPNDGEAQREPPSKRRKLSGSKPDELDGAESDGDGETDSEWQRRSEDLWQSAVEAVSGVFGRRSLTDGDGLGAAVDSNNSNNSNIVGVDGVRSRYDDDRTLRAMTERMASHWKRRRLAIGSLMGECRLFPGLDAMHSVSPSNDRKVLCAQSPQTADSHEHGGSQSVSCGDTLSVVGFVDRDDKQWLPLPAVSRHFVAATAGGEHIVLFARDLMANRGKMAVVDLSAPPQAKWFGLLHADALSDCLLLDVLSPYINAPRLFQVETAKQPMPQYVVPDAVRTPAANSTMLAVYDAVSCHFATESNVIKDFEKLVRCFKQKKGGTQPMAQCFAVAESIRRRSRIFKVPHLLHHLHSVVIHETDRIALELDADPNAAGNGEVQTVRAQIEALRQMVSRCLTDKRAVIAMPTVQTMNVDVGPEAVATSMSPKNRGSGSGQRGRGR